MNANELLQQARDKANEAMKLLMDSANTKLARDEVGELAAEMQRIAAKLFESGNITEGLLANDLGTRLDQFAYAYWNVVSGAA